jgi:hypothetical protein
MAVERGALWRMRAVFFELTPHSPDRNLCGIPRKRASEGL